jgi:two-component system sensor histidine kinase ChiS
MGEGEATGEAKGEILVVEDDREINELVGAYAQIAGFGYRSALNGTDALTEVRRSHPALIVLDLMLPDLDGFEVCRRVRAEAQATGKPIPVIIILTALDGAKSRQQGFECGAVDYLTKPFDPDKLMDVISRHAAQTSPNDQASMTNK